MVFKKLHSIADEECGFWSIEIDKKLKKRKKYVECFLGV